MQNNNIVIRDVKDTDYQFVANLNHNNVEVLSPMDIAKIEYFRMQKKTNVNIITCEVDTIPYNEASLKFHAAMGFKEVGKLNIRNGSVSVSLLSLKVQ